jgi:N-acetylglucosamine malate deacetylase 2
MQEVRIQVVEAQAVTSKTSTASTFASRSSDTLVVEAADMRQVRRLAALELELQDMGTPAVKRTPRQMTRWFQPQFGHTAPNAIVRTQRTARYRMARHLKQDLLDRFCNGDSLPDENPSVMIIVAHQDDESVGAGSRLCKLTNAYVVHVTDGAPRNPEVAKRYGFETREQYAQARWNELQKAMELAGVPRERLIHLGYADGEAAYRMVDLVIDVAELIDQHAPDLVITHPYEGGHTDHDATAFAVHLACGILRREGTSPPVVLEMTSYHDREGQRVVHEFLPHERADRARRAVHLTDDEQDVKQKMFECFRTQQVVLNTFSTTIEKFRPAPRYVFTKPPHEGRLNYEKYGDRELGARWRYHAELAMAELRLRPA